jgi:chromate transporter
MIGAQIVLFFLLVLKAQSLSNNGIASLPSLHADLIGQGWANEQQFAGALVVGQTTPGPNGLWVVSLGYMLAGWLGAIVALSAAVIPPLLVLPIDALYRRFGALQPVEGFVRGIGLAVIGVSPIVLTEVVQGTGLDWGTAAIAVAAFGLVYSRRLPNVAVVAIAAGVGAAIYR